MNNDNDLKFAYSMTKLSGWLRHCIIPSDLAIIRSGSSIIRGAFTIIRGAFKHNFHILSYVAVLFASGLQ